MRIRISRRRLAVALISAVLLCASACFAFFESSSFMQAATRHAAIFQARELTSLGWVPYRDDVRSGERVLIVIPGVLEPLEDGFAPEVARKIQALGHYDRVLGIAYDWSLPTSKIAPVYAEFLDRLPARRIDLEGHSYGAIQTLAALNRSRMAPRNVIFLGAPLAGTPMASRTYLTRALLKLPGVIWDGNLGRFSRMQGNGAAKDLLPGSPVLHGLIKPFAQKVAAYHINLILIAGSNSPYAAKLADLYMRAFALECFACSTDSDGVIPVSSALGISQDSPLHALAHVKTFSVLHAEMERDPAIQAYVAAHLVR